MSERAREEGDGTDGEFEVVDMRTATPGRDPDLDDYDVVSSAVTKEGSVRSARSSTVSSRAGSASLAESGGGDAHAGLGSESAGPGKRKRSDASPATVLAERGSDSGGEGAQAETGAGRRGRRAGQKTRR